MPCESDSEESVGYQEERGWMRKMQRWDRHCVVISEYWPSWAFALQSLGVTKLETWMPVAGSAGLREIRETHVGGTLRQGNESVIRKEADQGRWSGCLFFLQGSPSFVQTMRGILQVVKDTRMIGVVGAGSSRVEADIGKILTWSPESSFTVKHSQAGGVTRGRWKLFSDLKLQGLKSSQVKRVLGNILVSTESGVEVAGDMVKKHSLFVTKDQRIDVRQRHLRLAVPSCFVRDPEKLVERDISDKELMAAYDMEEGVMKSLGAYSRHMGRPMSRDFVMEAPLKVLHGIGRLVKEADIGSAEGRVMEAEPGTSEAHCTSRVGGDRKAKRRDRVSEGRDGKRARIEGEPQLLKGFKSEVATKSDDAPVDVTDWDIWTVNNYTPPEATYSKSSGKSKVLFKESPKGSVLVCKPGSYVPDKHGRLFDALRILLLRRARRNALRGLIVYMRQKYGNTMSLTFVGELPREGLGDDRKGGKRAKASSRMTSSSSSVEKNDNRSRNESVCAGRKFEVHSWVFHPRRNYQRGRHRSKDCGTDPEVEFFKDARVGCDALKRLAYSSWWSWDVGSTLFFWRWPRRYQRAIRDGTKLFVKKEQLPHHFKRQMWPSDPLHKEKMKEKLGKVRDRGYILPGEVNSLTGFFAVPKGSDDIRIVYDASACGLNAALWAPNFALPTIDSVLRCADQSTWFSDIDLGEMFLNYFLDEDLREYAGVDVREIGGAKWERWERTLMGFRSSPYVCTQTFAWGDAIIRGDRKDRDNPLRWDEVIMNLPGSQDYDPSMPWVYKWDSVNERLASDFACYIDDIRGLGGTESVCRATTRRVASYVNYLGQQDAPRKRRPPSKTPGAWAGAMCLSKDDGLYVTCTQDKWNKAKTIIDYWMTTVVEMKEEKLDVRKMEKEVGFLVHMSRTFPSMFPYLKGFYLTMNSWRSGRNDEGWKYSMSEWRAALGLDNSIPSYKVKEESKKGKKSASHDDRPAYVSPVPRLQPDLVALKELFQQDNPVHRLVRGRKMSSAKIAFGDASGGGFGSSWESSRGTEVDDSEAHVGFRFGTWDQNSSSKSSNYREMCNLVETLEAMASEGELAGCELFLFTDNSTAEAAFFKGSSSSRDLFDLVLRLRKLEMNQSCRIYVSHVAGTRMIAQGSDGLSRGNLSEGIMGGMDMHSFVPIHKTALDRNPNLKEWLTRLTNNDGTFLTPADWFTTGQEIVEGEWEINTEGLKFPKVKPGTFIWTPPPVAGGIAVEELRKSRHKSAESTHVFVLPRLCATEWRKQLHKAADVVLTLPAGHPAWPDCMHEPLTIAILYPYMSHRPWELRRAPILLELADTLHGVWKSGGSSEGSLLRELWSLQRNLASLPEGLAWKMLYGKLADYLQDSATRKRRRSSVAEGKTRGSVHKSQKR